MLILWIPLGVAIIYLLLHHLYLHVWARGLTVQLAFSQHAVSEGQEATLRATVANAKPLPLPVVVLRYKLGRGLSMAENPNATVTDMLNVVEYFSILGNEQVVRDQKVEATRRGCYHIDTLDLMMPQLISGRESFFFMPQDTELIVYPRLLDTPEMWGICEKITGDVISRRRLFEDVFSFRGIRDYTLTDPLSAVNWKASARTGRMMVNLRDYTFGQEVRILLNLEEPNFRYGGELLENAIRIAATVACRAISDRIPVSITSNGRIAGEPLPDLLSRRENAKPQRITHRRFRLFGGIMKANVPPAPHPQDRGQTHASPAPQPHAHPSEQPSRTRSNHANANSSLVYGARPDSPSAGPDIHGARPDSPSAGPDIHGTRPEPAAGPHIHDDRLQISAGGSQDHIGVIGEGLARLDITREMDSFADIMHLERERLQDSYVTVCLISTGRSDAIIREAELMARKLDGIFWICPLRKDAEDKFIPPNIDFRRVNF